ncbi:MAG: DUF3604 domain-containing protein [Clostridia bacterium]|nr:DUF3604 domain-containing protein [Clostridia bacterium]
MNHPERKIARRFDLPYRCHGVTEVVYGGEAGSIEKLKSAEEKHLPETPEYRVFYGEIHGHSSLSDGKTDPEEYYRQIRDEAKLDFAALTDHDHGGVGKPELWGEKWERTKALAKKYNEPGRFTTLLAYERDSYPWYNNAIVYYDHYDAELLRGERDGEITREELHRWLAREDLLFIPHDTSTLLWGTDFYTLEEQDMTSLLQVYSRYNHGERRDPALMYDSDCEGGHWQDALERGAKMGCVAGSDDHSPINGRYCPDRPYPHCWPGITGVWAKENTLSSLFEALKARRCYAFMGGRIELDFRLNGHYMGEEITDVGERALYFKIVADGEIDTVTVVKNSRDYIVLQGKTEQALLDYRQERKTDYYYLRVKLTDGRYAWSSPIWVHKEDGR